MKLALPIHELGDFSRWNLRARLPPSGAELWNLWSHRQKTYSVHSDTRSIVFRWLDHAWAPGKPLIVQNGTGADPALTDAVTGCASALEACLGGTVVRLMLAELRAGGEIAPHVDRGPALVLSHRCHIPVTTNPDVEFWIDHERHHLREGIAYDIDNTRLHAVVNRGTTARVHLICDVLPAGAEHEISSER